MKNNYMEFVEELRQLLLVKTGIEEKYIYFKEKEKYPPSSSDRLCMVCYEQEGQREVCALYIHDLFLDYQNGVSLADICEMVLKEIERIPLDSIIYTANTLKDYEKIREKLFVRLLNVEKNREELKNAVYYVLGDIALVLYLKVGEQEECMTSMKIREEMLKYWGKKRYEVFLVGLWNTYGSTPPRIYSWERLLVDEDYAGESFMDCLPKYGVNKEEVGNCLSTSKRSNGAVAIFLPGVANRLAELIGNSFYMVFTSVHEVMIHNADCADVEYLKKILALTVRDTTPEQDFLTLKIYHYDIDSKEFTCVM